MTVDKDLINSTDVAKPTIGSHSRPSGLLTIVVFVLIGAAGSKGIDAWLAMRASDQGRFDIEFPMAQLHSSALAKSLAEKPPHSAADVDVLLKSIRNHRSHMVNEEARAVLLQDLADLSQARNYFRSAESNDTQSAHLREARPSGAVVSASGQQGQPGGQEWPLSPERVIVVLEESSVEDRSRAAVVISRLKQRIDPFHGGVSAPKPTVTASAATSGTKVLR